MVNNGVILLDYAQLLIDRKKVENNLEPSDYLNRNDLFEAIVKAGKTRLRPVILTATTIFGRLILNK